MSEIKNVPIDRLNPNPYRNLKEYPWIERKLEALRKSIKDVGMWEGVIARKNGTGYQLAFGHHRLKAAKDVKLKTVPVIIKPLTDAQMLQYMGRENMDDYSHEFLVMLNGWKAGRKYVCEQTGNPSPQVVDIARELGWTINVMSRHNIRAGNQTAHACAGALTLINEGITQRQVFAGITCTAAK